MAAVRCGRQRGAGARPQPDMRRRVPSVEASLLAYKPALALLRMCMHCRFTFYACVCAVGLLLRMCMCCGFTFTLVHVLWVYFYACVYTMRLLLRMCIYCELARLVSTYGLPKPEPPDVSDGCPSGSVSFGMALSLC